MGDPGDWERHITLRDGRVVFVRPIRPEDEALYGTFLAAVTSEDARMRFLAPVGQLSHSLIEYFTHIDYARAMAFVAIDEVTGELLAVVRLHNNAADESGEYAIVVRSDYKGRGLGWQLMQMMIAYGRARGLREHRRQGAAREQGHARYVPAVRIRDRYRSEERIDLRREACALG